MISKGEIEKLAALSRIKLNPEQADKFHEEINNILSYVRQIQEVSSSGVDQDLPAGVFSMIKNEMREDKNPHPGGEFSEDILNQAPDRQENYFKVKKIL